MRARYFFLGLAFIAFGLSAVNAKVPQGDVPVDEARLRAADKEPGNWMSHGRDYGEQRYSPLDKINTGNVKDLSLAWSYELSTNRGVEVTPIVVDGVMYVTSAWSWVYALDAKTGKELWKYNPEVPKETGFKACCDVVNRGVAIWKGRVYVAAFDGRLIALDAKTGKVEWSVQTVDTKKAYTITMAPRVVKGKVIVGNSGSEYDVRGYLSAYDVHSGKLIWRFYTVPGEPSKPFENNAMEMAAKTWTGDKWWTMGGGASPWDAIAYDPDTNLLYFGTGNSLPWDQKQRSPKGGDNLFGACIIAVNADNGTYVWHYQTTPGDSWDFDATQTLTLANLTIDGKTRKVLMQANKNGFFYVLDRLTGQLISANSYGLVTWAKGIDMKTGRPIEVGDTHYAKGPFRMAPGAMGAHNWHPMSFSPKTKLVYIPALQSGSFYGSDPAFTYIEGQWNHAVNPAVQVLPPDPKIREAAKQANKGFLVAWDPVNQKEAWRVAHKQTWNGGTLATAGDLVFQGTSDGTFNAYNAASGAPVWTTETYFPTLAGPVSYAVDGEQYVAVGAGTGTVGFVAMGFLMDKKGTPDKGQILVYKLGGKAVTPRPQVVSAELAKPPTMTATPEVVGAGALKYAKFCQSCHGVGAIGGGVIPDLRHSPFITTAEGFKSIVLDGALKAKGMVGFSQVLTKEGAEAIRAYLISEAHFGYKPAPESKPK